MSSSAGRGDRGRSKRAVIAEWYGLPKGSPATAVTTWFRSAVSQRLAHRPYLESGIWGSWPVEKLTSSVNCGSVVDLVERCGWLPRYKVSEAGFCEVEIRVVLEESLQLGFARKNSELVVVVVGVLKPFNKEGGAEGRPRLCSP